MRDARGYHDRLQSSVFGRLVVANSIKQLTFSQTGIVDTAIVGRYLGENGLAALSVQDAVRYFPMSVTSGIGSTTLVLTGILAAEQDAGDSTLLRDIS